MVSCSSALALLITMADVFLSYRDGVGDIRHIHRQLALFHGDVLVHQIWTQNDEAAARSLSGLVRLDAVDRAELSWEDSAGLASGDEWNSDDIFTSITLVKKNIGNNYVLGELKLYSSLNNLRQTIASQIVFKLLLNFLKTLIVASVVLYFFHKLATIHLLRIARHTQAMQPGTEYKPLVLKRNSPASDDELSLLSNAINTMGERQQSAHLSAEQQNKALEKLVDERTEHLARVNQRLLEDSQLATIGSLVAMVAHELRNPLGTIKATATLLQAHTDKEFERKALRRIDRSVERCDDTVEQLRRAGSRTKQHWVKLDFGAWVENYVETQLEIDSKTIVDLDLPLGRDIFVDQFQLDLVVRNLFENAQQAIQDLPEGTERRILVKLFSDSRSATLQINDSGVGLNPDVLDRAFNPLFTTKQYGFGMGLSLSRNLVRSFGGTLDIHSEGAMQGARVELVLPLAHLVSRESDLLNIS